MAGIGSDGPFKWRNSAGANPLALTYPLGVRAGRSEDEGGVGIERAPGAMVLYLAGAAAQAVEAQ